MEKISNSYLLEIEGGGFRALLTKIVVKLSVIFKISVRLVRF